MGDLRLKLQRGLLSGLLVCGAPALAQTSLSNEAAIRSADARDAYSLIEAGDLAYLEQNFKVAGSKYAEALSKLPEGAKSIVGLRASALQRFTQASFAQAQHLMRRGDAKGVKALLDEVETVDPANPQLKVYRAKMDDPIRNNPALTSKHSENIDRVRRLLYKAEGYYDLGKFDRAYLTYEDILRIDKHNKAARRGMERSNAAISDYATSARDQARAEAFKDVDEEWEQKVYKEEDRPIVGGGDSIITGSGMDLLTKMNTIMVPELILNGASLDEAVDFLRLAAVQGDRTTLDENEKGVPYVIQLGDETHPAVKKIRGARINLKLRNVPLSEAVRLVTEASGTTFRVDEFAVVLNAAGFSDPTLIRRDFRVPPNFLTGVANTKVAGDPDPFADKAAEGGLIAKTLTAREKLQTYDVSFPDGASATYNPSSNILTVRNTVATMRLIEAIVEDIVKMEPVVVTIRTTLVDISQVNLEELGFDMMLGEFNVGEFGILSGGSTGVGTAINDMIPGNPVTSGNRSGDLSGTTDGLDAILARKSPPTASGTLSSDGNGNNANSINLPAGTNGGASRASGIISLRGLIDGTAHEILMRGLSQKKGSDIMVRPEVVTRSGENASIHSIIEFPYPEEYEPPEIPNAVGGNDGIVTPATPTNFTVANLGVSLEVLPQVGPDRRIIEVALNPVIRDFEGFVNYGTPIVGSSNTTTVNLVDNTAATDSVFGEITSNAILKPIFRTIRGKTSLRVLDGQTIVMGGLVTERRRQINDKVPILGDLPFVGRIFRNDGISVEKRSVLIFVNVELTDPAGNPYRDR
jgi:general secretion pathway protein D